MSDKCPVCKNSPCVCDPSDFDFDFMLQENPSDNGRSINGAYSHPMDWSPFDEQTGGF